MTTARDIVTAAFRKTGMGGVGDALSADEIAEGVDALNRMMHGWKLQGADVTHTDLEASDVFALGSEFEEGTVYLLAERISPDYTRPVAFDADRFWRAIQAAYTVVEPAALPTALRYVPSSIIRRSGWSE